MSGTFSDSSATRSALPMPWIPSAVATRRSGESADSWPMEMRTRCSAAQPVDTQSTARDGRDRRTSPESACAGQWQTPGPGNRSAGCVRRRGGAGAGPSTTDLESRIQKGTWRPPLQLPRPQ